MTILYAEKFAKYNDDQDIITDNPTYGSSGTSRTMQTAQGRFGGTVLQVTSSSTYIQFPWAAVSASDTAIIGMSVRDMTGVLNEPTAQNLIGVVDASSQFHWRIDIVAGSLLLYRAGGATPVLTASAIGVIGTNVWHWIEIKAVMANAGSVEVRVDGVTVINVSADFRDGTVDALTSLRLYGGNFTRQFDDLIICDGAGATFNDFFGDTRMVATVPDADGSVVNWTASAGTNVSCVDDPLAAYDDDTTYISSATTDQESLFSHGAFTLTGVNSVKFVQLDTLARDDGTNTFRQLARSGGTTYDNGADKNHGTVYAWANHRWELDPNGGIAWTETNINAAEFGVRARP